jgi:hypothetical protein
VEKCQVKADSNGLQKDPGLPEIDKRSIGSSGTWALKFFCVETLEPRTIIATLLIVKCNLQFVPLASVTWESQGYTLWDMIKGKVLHSQMLRIQ